MSGFILYNSTTSSDIDAGAQIMSRKGFRDGNEFKHGDWRLRVWGKQLLPDLRLWESGPKGDRLYVFGSPIVPRRTWDEALPELRRACEAGGPDACGMAVKGSYLLLYWDGRTWKLHFDQAGTYHAF